jgi:MFS family permease
MYGLTRAMLTLVGAAVAGVLIWLATTLVPGEESAQISMGDHWAIVGLVAAAGLTMALSQLLGGWTKWGWPRVSAGVFLLAFLPVLIAGSWVLAAVEPGNHWLGGHVRNWSDDIGIGGLVGDLTLLYPAIAFGIGLVFGLTFDTTGPRVRRQEPVATPVAAGAHDGSADGEEVSDERRIHIREGTAPENAPAREPEAEAAPRTGEPTRS